MTFACVDMMGAVVSWTVTMKLPFVVLLCKSVAEQLTVVIPMANIVPDAGAQIAATDPSTISDEVAENVAIAPRAPVASRLMFAGRVRTGAVVSVTVIVKLSLAVLLRESVAEQFTEVKPTGNVLPEAGEQVTATAPSTRSVDVAENIAEAPAGLVASRLIFPGRVRTGAVVSVTVTVKLPLAVLLRESVAEQFTEVTPTGNVLPEAGEQVTETRPSTRSEAEAEYVAVAPDELVASVVMLAGRLSVGGVVS